MMHQCGGGGSVGSIIDWPGGDGSVECKVVAFVLFFFFFFFDKRSLTLIENGHFFFPNITNVDVQSFKQWI